MSCWAVIPLKSPERCKTRLADALSAAARRRLAREMFDVVLDAVVRADVERAIVVTPSRLRLPRGVVSLRDAESGLNAALELARLAATCGGATRLAIVAADLPHVSVADVDALVRAGTAAVAIAPDRSGTGTNALCIDPRIAFPFAFGPDSAHRHRAGAEQAGRAVRIVRRAGLAFDVDTPEDHAHLRTRATRLVLPALGAAGAA